MATRNFGYKPLKINYQQFLETIRMRWHKSTAKPELFRGRIFEITLGSMQISTTQKVFDMLTTMLSPTTWTISFLNQYVLCSSYNFLLPNIAISDAEFSVGTDASYCVLIVEIANSSNLERVKSGVPYYMNKGAKTHWLINLVDRTIEITTRNPSSNDAITRTYKEASVVPVTFDQITYGSFFLEDVIT